jgi:cell fate regulator YaaT (PSP1 superfamily)
MMTEELSSKENQLNTSRMKVVGIRTRSSAKSVIHSVGSISIRVGEKVKIRSKSGETDIGTVADNPRFLDSKYCPDDAPEVISSADPKDLENILEIEKLESKALDLSKRKIKEFKVPMQLISSHYTFSRHKVTFFFSSPGRVDFRKLVRALSEALSVRVEMRQVGIRDEAAMLGGCGDCGRTYCCSTFLKSFDPITVKMAKDQNLSLNPTKLSGGCGRLKCCLRFEHSHYLSSKKRLPACKKKVGGCNCGATVIQQDILKEQVTILLEDGDKIKVNADNLERMQTGQFAVKDISLTDRL